MNSARNCLTKTGVMDFIRKTKCFEQYLKTVDITVLEEGRCTAELKIEETHTNFMGSLHGGVSATLVDSISSYALTAMKDCDVPNVSVNINMKYLNSAVIGDVVIIDAQAIKVGKRIAFLEVSIKNKETGSLLVLGSHTKYLLRP